MIELKSHKKTQKQELLRLLESLHELALGLSVITSIGAAIAVQLLFEALQLNPSIWKSISIYSSITSSMFFFSSAFLYGFYHSVKLPVSIDSRNLKEFIAEFVMVIFTIAAYVALVIGLGCFVGAENHKYVWIVALTGFFPPLIFLNVVENLKHNYGTKNDEE
jgi:hypothetical protein